MARQSDFLELPVNLTVTRLQASKQTRLIDPLYRIISALSLSFSNVNKSINCTKRLKLSSSTPLMCSSLMFIRTPLESVTNLANHQLSGQIAQLIPAVYTGECDPSTLGKPSNITKNPASASCLCEIRNLHSGCS